MTEDNARYELILDPLDMWTVWDLTADQPAEFAGQLLMGLTEAEANDALRVMNELNLRRLAPGNGDTTMPPALEYREAGVVR
ncbi:hypothetical protein MRS76_21055 [Rhizobiaceae bacterium n13]|uniref:Uncharacterized protein n=1 Tax=Ferirhizobium litorale TaxID=2927786 RepID=A0AAE3QGB1_9HYPH|nr:hypothetical protein [Fererhizobium litorale]MDI7864431.1 hypothetical protein [Fererhizobium litorale]MDI7924655.1 hypothetical protein [Fererhizobium litorale]